MTILVIIESEPAVPRFIPVAIDDVQISVGPEYLVEASLIPEIKYSPYYISVAIMLAVVTGPAAFLLAWGLLHLHPRLSAWVRPRPDSRNHFWLTCCWWHSSVVDTLVAWALVARACLVSNLILRAARRMHPVR
jgi:hypothetical protein